MLRDQPYLPLYVQDFLTDEKLAECSAEATGVYIRLMCLMHKSEEYGVITLREKDFCRDICHGKTSGKQSGEINFFALKLTKHLPYSYDVILRSLEELSEERVLYIDGNNLCQKRMIHDAKISETRSKCGKKGAETTNNKFKKQTPKKEKETRNFAAAKSPANSENENEYEIHLSKSFKESNNKGGAGENEIEEIIPDDDFTIFQQWITSNASNVATMKEPFTRDQYEKLVIDYREEDIRSVVEAMHNYKPLKTKCVSANLTARNWLKRDKTPKRDAFVAGATGGKVGNVMNTIAEALKY